MQPKRTTRNVHVALGGLAAAGSLLAVGVSGLNPEGVVTSSFDTAFMKQVDRQRLRLAAQPGDRPHPAAYDGIAGNEAFWLGVANPEIAKAVAVGQPLTLRTAQGAADRRLIVTDVREIRPTGPVDETHIDTLSPADGARTFLIVCRDTQDPGAGEFHIRLRNGELALVEAPAQQSL